MGGLVVGWRGERHPPIRPLPPTGPRTLPARVRAAVSSPRWPSTPGAARPRRGDRRDHLRHRQGRRADVPILVAAIFAVIIALPLGMVAFKSLRLRVNAAIAEVDEDRRRKREALQSRLRGESGSRP